MGHPPGRDLGLADVRYSGHNRLSRHPGHSPPRRLHEPRPPGARARWVCALMAGPRVTLSLPPPAVSRTSPALELAASWLATRRILLAAPGGATTVRIRDYWRLDEWP